MTDQNRRPRSRSRRRIGSLLVRGPDSRPILDDMDELLARDIRDGIPRWRAELRYARNLIGSAYSVWRAGPRRPMLPVSWLDVKLAGRTLVKNPGVTLVSCFALAIGIPIGLAPFQLLSAINGPLPFDDAERILGITHWDLEASDGRRPRLHDFETWRRELSSFEALAAARSASQNLVDDDGRADVVRGSEMSASAFGILRVRPLHGRMLLEADEDPGAPPVVVIGYDLWQTRFGGDPAVLGTTLRLGGTRRTVVGIMPSGFLFPLRDMYWVPLQARAADYEWRSGPSVYVFGRLREGASRAEAQAELEAVAARTAADHPDTDAHLRADILPLPHVLTGLRADYATAAPLYVMTLLLLAVTCGNVGTLMLSRIASRSSEIAVRTALGASRTNIVSQLFVETLLIAAVAASVGLGLADRVVTLVPTFDGSGPFWFDLGIRPSTIVIASGLVVFSAVIAGVIPGLKATGRNVYRGLQRAGAGGSGLRFGAGSTLLIVAEVGLAVACLSGVAAVGVGPLREPSVARGTAAEDYLAARLRLPVDPATRANAETFDDDFAIRFGAIQEEVVRRVLAEPDVRAVTYANVLPGMDHPVRRIEVEGSDAPADALAGHRVRHARVDRHFFDALEQPVLAGRAFDTRDLIPGVRRSVIVNQSFVDDVLGGRNAIGKRIRYLAGQDEEPAPWLEIVGVVNDLGMNVADPERGAGIYHVMGPGEEHPVRLVVHLGGEPTAFVPRLRSILTEIEPVLLLDNPSPLDDVFSDLLWEARFSSLVFTLIAAIAIVLSAAGLYALMAFTVSERTREIGIRTALGAQPARIAAAILRRALLQIIAGVALGTWLGVAVVRDILNEALQEGNWPLMLTVVAALMLMIGLLACAAPTVRALRIQPSRALREGG